MPIAIAKMHTQGGKFRLAPVACALVALCSALIVHGVDTEFTSTDESVTMDVNEDGDAADLTDDMAHKEPEVPPLPGAGGVGPAGSEMLHSGSSVERLLADPWKGNPIQIEPTEHGNFIRGHENALVLLSGRRCHLCKRINREFVRAEWLGRSTELPVAMAVVNVESPEGTELLKRLNVGALPVMFLNMNHGKERIFIDEWWAAEPLIADVQLKLGLLNIIEPIRRLEDREDVPGWLFDRGNDQGTFETAAVVFIPNPEPHSDAVDAANMKCREEFTEAARSISQDEQTSFHNRPRFAQVTSRDVVASFGLPLDEPSIVVYKDFDDGKAIFGRKCVGDPNAVHEFIMAESTPRAVIVHHGNIKDHLSRKTNVVHVFVPAQTLDDGRTLQPVLKTLGDVSRRLEEAKLADRGEFMFFLSNGHQYRGWLSDYGLTEDELPAVGVDMITRERRYAIPTLSTARHIEAITAENVTQAEVEEARAAMATPDPTTGLMPEQPIVKDAAVTIDADELAKSVASVLDRKLKAFKHYGKKAPKKKATAKKAPKQARK